MTVHLFVCIENVLLLLKLGVVNDGISFATVNII